MTTAITRLAELAHAVGEPMADLTPAQWDRLEELARKFCEPHPDPFRLSTGERREFTELASRMIAAQGAVDATAFLAAPGERTGECPS